MKTKHTPGPWLETDGFNVYALRDSGPLPPIASCASSRTVTKAQQAANARLIAAAPDMVAAIADAVHAFDVLGYELPFDIQDALRAALAKARGEG